jgi:hypothetical protein
VTLVDANLLLHGYDSASPHHDRARGWLEAAMNGAEPVCLAWTTILAFLRIGTNSRVFERPLSIAEAVAIVTSWLEHPAIVTLNPEETHWPVLRGLLSEGQAHGPLVMDAHLAALAIEHGAALATTDKDFTRFPGLKFFNPLSTS